MSRTTLVIPNINGTEYIENCLDSVFASDVEVSVIVVDNGSTDGSVDIIKEKYPQVDLICHAENTGFCKATNEGAVKAETEFVMFLNNDTVIKEDAVRILEESMDAHPEAFSIQALMLSLKEPEIIDSAGDEYCALGWAFARKKGKNVSKLGQRDRLFNVFSGCGGACLYRKSVLDEIGVLDENHFAYLEDVDLGYRALIYGYKNYCAKNAVVYHAGSAFSGSRHNSFKVNLSSRNSIYLIYKNMPILQKIINLPFLLIGYLIKIAFFTLKGLGGTYVKGVFTGVKMSFGRETTPNRVKFRFKNLGNYFLIQFRLWINIFKRF